MFKIGEFSKLVRVSPRMLRHYEKCGLLHPAETDAFTGYRRYSAGQIPLIMNIRVLRSLGFSIDETEDILPHWGDKAYMNRVLRAKAGAVQSAIEAEQAKLEQIMKIIATIEKETDSMVYEVELKKLPAVKVLTLRGIIPKYNEEGILWEKLGRYIGEKGIACHSDGYSTYYDEEYKEEGPDVEIAIPVDVLGNNDGAFVYKEYGEIPLAATVRFTGPFDGGYDAADKKLAEWMEENGYTFAGPMRGHVLVSPDEEPNPEKWTTEIEVPVVKK